MSEAPAPTSSAELKAEAPPPAPAAPAAAAAAAAEEEPQVPIIPGCVQYKYYQTPRVRLPDGSSGDGVLRRLRPKRRVALIFGYVGERYCGLQWNRLPEYPTVEQALLKALFETDLVSLANFCSPKVQQLLNFERASRTDKGVHALRNLVSVALALPYDPDYVRALEAGGVAAAEAWARGGDDSGDGGGGGGPRDVYSCAEAKRLLNVALPEDVHVYAVVPVTRSFNAYMNCGYRRYEYYIPTFAFMEPAAYAALLPPALAPNTASLADIGFTRPRARGPAQQQSPASAAGGAAAAPATTAAPTTEEEEESRRRKRYDKLRRQQRGGRKTYGHYPKSKRRRLEERRAYEEWEKKELEGSAGERQQDTGSGSDEQSGSGSGSDGEGEGEAGVPALREGTDLAHTYAFNFNDGVFETMILYRQIPEEPMAALARYRLPAAQLQRVRALFAQYEGTHRYHNFTPGGRGSDASCHRFIRAVTVSEPFVVRSADPHVAASVAAWSPSRFFSPDAQLAEDYRDLLCGAGEDGEDGEEGCGGGGGEAALAAREAELRGRLAAHAARVYDAGGGLEVVRITLDGQSFMLNQIRKMIGAVICATAAGLPEGYIREQLLARGVRRCVPMVPANGLFLSHLDYSGYNKRLESIQGNGGNGRGKGGIDFDDPAQVPPAELEEQRARTVAVVLRNEMFEDRVGKWMRSLRHALHLGWGLDLP